METATQFRIIPQEQYSDILTHELVLFLRWHRTAVCALTQAVMAWVLPNLIFRQNGSFEMLTFQGNLLWRNLCAYAPEHGGQFTPVGNQY